MSAQLRRAIAGAVVLGIALQVVAHLLLHGAGALVHVPLATGLPHAGVLGVLALLALSMAGNLVAVPVRRGDEVEELTLFEAAVVVDLLLLPAHSALWIPPAAVALCGALGRKDPVKTLFNTGNLAAATAVLLLAVHAVAAPARGLGLGSVTGLVLGLCAFTTVNLLALSRVLKAVAGVEPGAVLRDGARLAVLTVPGTISIAGSMVLALVLAPALVPFSLVPAVAMVFAFRARAEESQERERSAQLLALSNRLAARDGTEDLLPVFLRLVRQAFDADTAVAVLDPAAEPGGSAPSAVVADRDAVADAREATPAEAELLRAAAADGAQQLPDGLLVPLEAEGRRVGAVALHRERRRLAARLGARELTLLGPLAGALASALQAAAHLRRLVEESSKLKAVVDQSSDGILVLDGGGAVQLWSPAVAALTGRTAAAAHGRPLSSLLATIGADGTPCDPYDAGRALLSPSTPRATVELTVLRQDGEQRVVRCAHAGMFDDEGALLRDVVILHDVTRERQVERLKADFIATVSHELRTPVTPIKGYADLLRRRGASMTEDKRAECLDVIHDRASHLARLVEDLLLASRISATEGSAPAQVDMGVEELVEVVRRACGDFGAEGERVGVALPDVPVLVSCDRVRVIQVLSNMIGNALKYSTPGTPVEVRLAVGDGRAVVEVEDRGRGIPGDQVERVFEKFHRVEDPMRMTTGGTGLGLYIARQLATAMGGSLACRSTLGVGSVFTFTLPLAPDGAVVAAPHPAAAWRSAGAGGAGVPLPRAAQAGEPGAARAVRAAGPGGRRTPPWAARPTAPGPTPG